MLRLEIRLEAPTGPNTFALDVDLIFPSDGYYNLRFDRSELTPNFEFVTLPDWAIAWS